MLSHTKTLHQLSNFIVEHLIRHPRTLLCILVSHGLSNLMHRMRADFLISYQPIKCKLLKFFYVFFTFFSWLAQLIKSAHPLHQVRQSTSTSILFSLVVFTYGQLSLFILGQNLQMGSSTMRINLYLKVQLVSN